MNIILRKYFSPLLMCFWFSIAGGFFDVELFAQHNMADVYEGIATVQVESENYVVARKKAVNLALKNGLEEALKDLMGEEEFEISYRELRKILRRASHYVKSYRFVEAHDDLMSRTSDVRLEMRFFSSALSQALSGLGVISGQINEKKVIDELDKK